MRGEVATLEQTRAEQALASLQQQLAAVNEAATQVEGARVRLEAAKQHADRCRRLLSARDTLEEAEERCARFMAAEADALEGLRQAESELQTLEDKWRAGRAVALAARLVPGQPCPVCGATDHPSPAQAGEEDVADEHLTAAKSSVEQARRAHADAHEVHGTGEKRGHGRADGRALHQGGTGRPHRPRPGRCRGSCERMHRRAGTAEYRG